jgi:hypothetical protein
MDLFIYNDFETREIHWSYSAPSDKEKVRVPKGLINLYKITNFPKGPAYRWSSGAWVSQTYNNPDSRGYQSLVHGTLTVRFRNQQMDRIEIFDGNKDWVPISEL